MQLVRDKFKPKDVKDDLDLTVEGAVCLSVCLSVGLSICLGRLDQRNLFIFLVETNIRH